MVKVRSDVDESCSYGSWLAVVLHAFPTQSRILLKLKHSQNTNLFQCENVKLKMRSHNVNLKVARYSNAHKHLKYKWRASNFLLFTQIGLAILLTTNS